MADDIEVREKLVADEVQQIRDQLYRDAAATVAGALRWADVDEDQDEPPEKWVDTYGEETAMKMLRCAKEAKKPQKDAAYGLKLSLDTMIGIGKEWAQEKSAPRQLGVEVILSPVPDVESIEIKKLEG